MNDVIQTQLAHKTVRAFTPETVTDDILTTLYQVAMRTATSSSLQASSIIRLTDVKLKQQISEICNQEFIAELPELWIFIVDGYRNRKITEAIHSPEEGSYTTRKFFQSYIDAALTAQNVTLAAESLGLGTVYLGSIHNDVGRLIELLKLPELTFPVVGLGFGYPNDQPKHELKPRMGQELRIFENEYHQFADYLNEIQEYDQQMMNYFKLRANNQKTESFSSLVASSLTRTKNVNIIAQIKKQGFKISDL